MHDYPFLDPPQMRSADSLPVRLITTQVETCAFRTCLLPGDITTTTLRRGMKAEA